MIVFDDDIKTGIWYERIRPHNDEYIHKELIYFRNLEWHDQDSSHWSIDTNGGESKVTCWFEKKTFGSVPTGHSDNTGLRRINMDYTDWLLNVCQETGLSPRKLFVAVLKTPLTY
jgi:hypothetical protein